MSELLYAAFLALGTRPARREVVLVANALRDSGDEEALGLLDAVKARGEYRGAEWEEIVRLAIEAGAGPYTALELVPEYANPGMFKRLGLVH